MQLFWGNREVVGEVASPRHGVVSRRGSRRGAIGPVSPDSAVRGVRMARRVLLGIVLLSWLIMFVGGCTRGRYRLRADRDAYTILGEKTIAQPWQPPSDFDVVPSPLSRLYDPTPPNDPLLPIPSPQLYAYDIPALPERDPARFTPPNRSSVGESTQLGAVLAALDPSGASPADPGAEFAPILQASGTVPTSDSVTMPLRSRQDRRAQPRLQAELTLDSERTASRSLVAEPDLAFAESDGTLAGDGAWAQPVAERATPVRPRTSFSPALPATADEVRAARVGSTRSDVAVDESANQQPAKATAVRAASFQSDALELLPEPANQIPANSPPASVPATAPPDSSPAPNREDAPRTLPTDRISPGDTGGTSNQGVTPAEVEREAGVRQLGPIPASAWQSIPESCLRRMFEFESVQTEYARSFRRAPSEEERDSARRLALEDIVDLALLNSREYQNQKEQLYTAALNLSLDRFAYDLKFTTGGNRVTPEWTHDRVRGITTENQLSVPTTSTVDKTMVTAGELVGRFANRVVLTFNGPNGFAADIGSDLLLDLSQTVFQRDVRFETLTQGERDVIYAARNFLRFRKEFFVGLADQYYELLTRYREVEIASQDYFTLVRAFDEANEEARRGFRSQVEVDQVEQNVLANGRKLIESCNTVELLLDGLKLSLGLPTETPINLDLTELTRLTLRDELAVSAESILRVRRRMEAERGESDPDRVVLLSASITLLDRILTAFNLLEQLDQQTPERAELEGLRAHLRVDAARVRVSEFRSELDEELADQPPNPAIVIQRTRDLIEALTELLDQQLDELSRQTPDRLPAAQARVTQVKSAAEELDRQLTEMLAAGGLEQLNALVTRATALREQTERLVGELDESLGRTALNDPAVVFQETLQQTDQLLATSRTIVDRFSAGLVPIEITPDDAMMTALVLRLDLMNERGNVADQWRLIKLRADDLKSVLNLQATQNIRTRSDVNRPFDFTFDDSTTQLGASLDLPFNRMAQRNAFRISLFNYQSSLRNWMRVEDAIKFDVRKNLRDLSQKRQQYLINVASTALASERVASTAIQLQLGMPGVAARDFLEAQQDYIVSLSRVASGHIDYVRLRMQLFLDLELLQVGDDGFWHDLYDEQIQPEPFFQLPEYAMPAYGDLPHGLMFSHKIRRMLSVPVGMAGVHSTQPD